MRAHYQDSVPLILINGASKVNSRSGTKKALYHSFNYVCVNFRRNPGSSTLHKDWASWKNMLLT